MTIKFNEYSINLAKCDGDKQKIVDLFVSYAAELNKDDFKNMDLPDNSAMAKIKKVKRLGGFVSAPLQQPTIVSPQMLKNIKMMSTKEVPLDDIALASMCEFIEKNNGATPKEFKEMVVKKINQREKSLDFNHSKGVEMG